MSTQLDHTKKADVKATTGGGLVLVFFPSCAIVFGQETFSKNLVVGLPTLAILGIMILFGALCLISTIFERLGLANKEEALALPPGSIRAAIALSLIVLFALIAIMLFHSTAEPYAVPNLTLDQKNTLVTDPTYRVIAAIKQACPTKECIQELFTAHLIQLQSKDSTDLAKQLLILIGTLMTSVTSFYFGARTSATATVSEFALLQCKAINEKLGLSTSNARIDEPNLPDKIL